MPTSDPSPAIQHARQPVIDAIAQAFALYGWPEITGRLFAQLYLDGSPRSQDELADVVAMSKATVSTNLRTLEILHLVHRVASPANSESSETGGRPRVYYQAERDFMKVAQELLRHNARRETELIGRGLAESRRRLHDLAAQTNGPDSATIQTAPPSKMTCWPSTRSKATNAGVSVCSGCCKAPSACSGS